MSKTYDQKTIEAFKQKKRGMLFDYMDTKRDGVLEFEELMYHPNKITQSGKKELGERLASLYSEAWKRICEVHNLSSDNTSLTKEQFVAGWKVLEKTTWFQKTGVPEVARIYFDSLDSDHDQTISLKEWRVYNNNRGFTDERVIESTFNRLDADGDGRISREEMERAIHRFSFGDDPAEDYSFIYSME